MKSCTINVRETSSIKPWVYVRDPCDPSSSHSLISLMITSRPHPFSHVVRICFSFIDYHIFLGANLEPHERFSLQHGTLHGYLATLRSIDALRDVWRG
ncbi:hypothetical protein [Metallosphaera javensis (ex Hofmann et al. 2022)]|uniref:hypothetical protein n=1 Tax=Metallosphaera javensis (ex Hofmann et al. 2022) TaxID=99938 RepID=UPI001EDD174F|nr:hypothetical protein [Metallosphaera javensis (ex Hofmann et al. 2022)]